MAANKDVVTLSAHLPIVFNEYRFFLAAIHEVDYYRKVARKVGAELAAIEMAMFPLEAPPFFKDAAKRNEYYKQERDAFQKGYAELLKQGGDKHVYFTKVEGLVHLLAPTWPAWLCQNLTRELESKWYTKDPDLSRPRCALVREGRRLPLQFNNAPLPLQNAGSVRAVKFTERGAVLNWDKQLGPVEVSLAPGVDGHTYKLFCKLRDNPDIVRSGKLLMQRYKDGKRTRYRFRLDIAYQVAKSETGPDPKKSMEVGFGETPEEWIKLRIREGKTYTLFDCLRKKELAATACLDGLAGLSKQKDKLDPLIRACGYSGNAIASMRERQNKLTKRRDGLIKHWVGTWSRIIVDEALRKGCGCIEVIGMPGKLFGEPWQGALFTFALKYKADMHRIKVSVSDGADVEEVVEDIVESAAEAACLGGQ